MSASVRGKCVRLEILFHQKGLDRQKRDLSSQILDNPPEIIKVFLFPNSAGLIELQIRFRRAD